jgi:hypothetical protein
MDQLAEPADDTHTEPSLHERHSERNAAEGKFPGVGKDPLQRGGVTLATIDWIKKILFEVLEGARKSDGCSNAWDAVGRHTWEPMNKRRHQTVDTDSGRSVGRAHMQSAS